MQLNSPIGGLTTVIASIPVMLNRGQSGYPTADSPGAAAASTTTTVSATSAGSAFATSGRNVNQVGEDS